MAAEVPARVRRLIFERIESVEQLEVLLLLRAAPDKSWTADEVARALVSRVESTGAWLERLEGDGLLVRRDAAYTYAPATAEDATTVEGLAESYAKYRVTVIALIFSKPTDRVRTFPDALPTRRTGRDRSLR